MGQSEDSVNQHEVTVSYICRRTGALRPRMAQGMLLFLLAVNGAGCSTDETDPKKLIGKWTSGGTGKSYEMLTFFQDGTFSRELKEDTGTGAMRTVLTARGKWQEGSGTLRLTSDQNSTADLSKTLWASGEYRWALKEAGKELHLNRAGDAQSFVYRRLQ